MKKKIAMLLVVVMMMLMGTTAFAAESPTTDTSGTTDSDATDYGNAHIAGDSVVVNGVVIPKVPEVNHVKKSKVDEAQKEAEKLVAPTAKVIQIIDVELYGEGFILQKVSGHGIAFAEFDGHVVEYELAAGQQIVIDSGHLAAMTLSCSMDIKTVPGLKNALFGGEGIFNTVVTGPGRVWVQTMPISRVAGAIQPYIITGK